MALLKLERFIDAISDFQKAIEYNLHYFYAYYDLAAVYDYLDRTEEASIVREEMLAIFSRIS